MTDRVQHLTVLLEGDYRTDDVEAVVNAIEMVKGVKRVTLGKPVGGEDWFARERVGYNMRQQVIAAMDEIIRGKQ